MSLVTQKSRGYFLAFSHTADLNVFNKFSFSRLQKPSVFGSFPSLYEPYFEQAMSIQTEFPDFLC